MSADFENGFGSDPEGVAQSVRHALDTGIAGLSIEDSTGDPSQPQFELSVAVARLRAARGAIDDAGGDILLTGRAENFLVGRPDLEDTIRRLKAYAEAGADCLYAPAITTREQIRAVVSAVAPKPVNFLMGWDGEETVADFEKLGVRRISVGTSLAAAAWGGFMRAAQAIADRGAFSGFRDIASGVQLNNYFKMTVEDGPMTRSARVIGEVQYREGEGTMMLIPCGPVEVETTASDAVLSWTDGDTSATAAMPIANFCSYVAFGAISVKA